MQPPSTSHPTLPNTNNAHSSMGAPFTCGPYPALAAWMSVTTKQRLQQQQGLPASLLQSTPHLSVSSPAFLSPLRRRGFMLKNLSASSPQRPHMPRYSICTAGHAGSSSSSSSGSMVYAWILQTPHSAASNLQLCGMTVTFIAVIAALMMHCEAACV